MTVQENTALLIIDVINKMDFEGAEQLLQQTLPVLEPLSKLKQYCKRQNIPVIYVNDNFGLWQE
ncbi:MAG: cysteine hydrolase, partial [Exiguobacterium indicum]